VFCLLNYCPQVDDDTRLIEKPSVPEWKLWCFACCELTDWAYDDRISAQEPEQGTLPTIRQACDHDRNLHGLGGERNPLITLAGPMTDDQPPFAKFNLERVIARWTFRDIKAKRLKL
jgi:hypothetical protein